MRKLVRISLWSLAVLAVLVLLLGLYLRNTDLSVYEEPIEGYLSKKIGYELDFGGLFELRFGSLTELAADEVTLSNPDWPGESAIVSAGHISITIDLWSLIRGPLIIEELDVRQVRVYLERDAEGLSNWTTGKPVSSEATEFDTELIAFRDVNIKSVQILYIDPTRRLPLDISIEQLVVSPDENDILDLDLQGAVNEFPLWADGKLGPWQNLLDGKDLIADLDVTLGQVRFAVAGSGEDTRALRGIEATLSLGGPSIDRVADRLGFPPFAEGPFQIDGRLRKLDDGNQIRLEGNLGAISVFASGSVDRLLSPSSTQYDFNVAGPDSRYVAEVFGVNGVPNVPFQVTGDFSREGMRLSFAATRIELGENTVAVDGWFDASTAMPDMDVTIKASGPDFSVFAPFMNIKGIPADAFDIDGRIEKSGESWRFSEVVGTVGDNRVAANGSISPGEDTQVEFSATGPDVSSLQALAGAHDWPEKPFDVSALVKPARGGVRVEDATGLFGDNRIEVDGLISTGAGLAGTHLAIRASGSELSHVSVLTGVPYLPGGNFDISGNVDLDRDRLVISDISATAGELQASASATVGLGRKAGEFDIVVTASGPDVANAAQVDLLQRLSGEPFTLDARILRHNNREELQFEKTNLRIGQLVMVADGTMSMEPSSNDSDLKFSLSGPDMAHLGRALGTDLLLPTAFDVNGQLTGTPSGFAMHDFVARIGDNDVSGVFEVDLRDKPRLTGTLSSTYLDVTERLQQTEEPAEAEASKEEGEFIFSDEPLDAGFLQSVDIELDVRIDNLRARALAVGDVHVGIELQDGELQIDPISFTESQGSVNGLVRIGPSAGTYALDASLLVQNMHFGSVALQDQDRTTLPPTSGELKLRGAGSSIHELLASSNGELALRQGSGRIKDMGADRIFGDIVLKILRALNPMREEQGYREFDCGIYHVNIIDGIATSEKLAVQTGTMTVLVVGNLDFNTEKLDFVIRAKPREGLGISVGGAINSFLKLGGTLRNPKLQIDPKGTVVSGSVAVATGGLSLLAKGLFDRLSAEVDICAQDEAVNEN